MNTLFAVSNSNLAQASHSEMSSGAIGAALLKVIKSNLPGGPPHRWTDGDDTSHYDTVPRPHDYSKPFSQEKNLEELYFQFGNYDGKGEFSVPWGRNGSKENPTSRKVLASYLRDPDDRKSQWDLGLDAALIKLATGVRIRKPRPRWPITNAVMWEEMEASFDRTITNYKPSTPERPICKVKLLSWKVDKKEARAITFNSPLVALPPDLADSSRFYAVHSVQPLPGDEPYKGLFGEVRRKKIKSSAILGQWQEPKTEEALWIFGLFRSIYGARITACSLLLQSDRSNPVVLARAVRTYDSRTLSLKKTFDEMEDNARIWDTKEPPIYFPEKLHHDFLLELLSIALLYGGENQPLQELVQLAATQEILPVAFYKEGRLYPINDDNIDKAQQIVLNALGLS